MTKQEQHIFDIKTNSHKMNRWSKVLADKGYGIEFTGLKKVPLTETTNRYDVVAKITKGDSVVEDAISGKDLSDFMTKIQRPAKKEKVAAK